MPFADLFQRRNSTSNTRNPSVPPPLNTAPQPPKEVRRVIGYHNAIIVDGEGDDDASAYPPGYDAAVLTRRIRHAARKEERVQEQLPKYSCSISLEAPVEVHFEQSHPFDVFKKQQWVQTYAVLSGSLLRLHALKRATPGILSLSSDRSQAGKLLRAYSLQHAEIGIAADEPKQQMIPKSPYIAMLPEATVEKLKITEPHLFDIVKRYFIRLRLEGEQILFRVETSEDRSRWIDRLCAAVDIAPPIDDRTEPKYHTLPRRRRRRQPPAGAGGNNDAAGPSNTGERNAVVMDLQTGFPVLAEQDTRLQRMATVDADPDNTEIDNCLAFAGVDMSEALPPERPSRISSDFRRMFSRRAMSNNVNQEVTSPTSPTTPLSTTVSQTVEAQREPLPLPKLNTKVPARMYPDDFVKWQPQFYIDSAQQIRYRRHCMPSLLYNSKRANDVILHQGKRWKIDWMQERLVPWPEAPPVYAPAKFKTVRVDQPRGETSVPIQAADATTSISDRSSEPAETAQTSIAAPSLPADSATASIHAGDSTVEGWNWSNSRSKLAPPIEDTTGMVHPVFSSDDRHAETFRDAAPITPDGTPRRLRRSSQQVSRTSGSISGSSHRPVVETDSEALTTPIAKSTGRSTRRSFQLFSRPSPAQLAANNEETTEAGENAEQAAASRTHRSSMTLKRPFSGRPSMDSTRPVIGTMACFSGPVTEQEQLEGPQPTSASRVSRLSTTIKRPFSGRPSLDTTRPEQAAESPTVNRTSRIPSQMLRHFSGRPSVDTNRTETLPTDPTVSSATPPSTRSGRTSFQFSRPSLDLFRSKDMALELSDPSQHADTPSPIRKSGRLSLQQNRPKMGDLVKPTKSQPPTSWKSPEDTTGRPGGWRQKLRRLSSKKDEVVNVPIAEKNVDVFGPSGHTSAWQSGRVSIVVE
jgi:hypothetical protein